MAEVDDLAAVIEADIIANYGGEENVSLDPTSYIRAGIYAKAYEIAWLELSSLAAGNQFIPSEATDLLSKFEWEYKLVPKISDDVATRQAALAAAAKLSGGAKRSNVESVLLDLLGADFIAYVTPDKTDTLNDFVTQYLEFGNGAFGVGNWVRPGTHAYVGRLLSNVVTTGPATVGYERIAGRETPPEVGETILLDPGYTRPEQIELTAVTANTFTGAFTLAHAEGTIFTTGRCPTATTPNRVNLIILTSAAARDAETRRKVNRVMGKLLRATSRWSIVEEASPGRAGPFRLGEGLLGVTALGVVVESGGFSAGSSAPTFNANATGRALKASAPSSTPTITGGATSRALKAAAGSSAPTITADAQNSGAQGSSSPTITANATSQALKASAGSSAPINTADAKSHALKQSAGSSTPTITGAATGQAG